MADGFEAWSDWRRFDIPKLEVVPEYDYMTVANTIDEIDRKILTIKHTLNLTNATAKVQVGAQEMSIDGILIRMAQLNKRKTVLDDMLLHMDFSGDRFPRLPPEIEIPYVLGSGSISAHSLLRFL